MSNTDLALWSVALCLVAGLIFIGITLVLGLLDNKIQHQTLISGGINFTTASIITVILVVVLLFMWCSELQDRGRTCKIEAAKVIEVQPGEVDSLEYASALNEMC